MRRDTCARAEREAELPFPKVAMYTSLVEKDSSSHGDEHANVKSETDLR